MRTSVRIKLPPRSWFVNKGIEVPQHVWRSGAFVFHPEPFMPDNDRLAKRVIESSFQLKAYNGWKASPSMFDGSVYMCADEPAGSRAKYFAAHLLYLWLKSIEKVNKTPQVTWITCRPPDWEIGKDLLDGIAHTDFLVIDNLTPNSSRARLERVRDLVISQHDIPVVLVIAGEDPISFGARRLFLPVNAVFFHSSKLIKRNIEII